MNLNLIEKSGYEIARDIKDKKINPEEVYSFFKERIDKYNPRLNAFIEAYPDFSLSSSQNSSLFGLPIAIKDNICIQGKEITCASKILSSCRAVYDATVIRKLKEAGLSLIGTTNMDEFAFGSSTENSCYGPSKNPWDTDRVPGGSSGGSAAAVAARLVPFALGSDTAGSIRQPASLCGVVGFKPTYGRVSRFGLVAFGSSLDQIGPITGNIKDCASLLDIICGPDKFDSTTAQAGEQNFTEALGQDISSLKIGLPKEYFGEGLDPQIKERIEAAINFFKKEKVEFVQVSLPHTQYALPAYYVIACSEASSNLQRFDGIRYGQRAQGNKLGPVYEKSRRLGFGRETKRRILLGTYSLSSGYYDLYYTRALKVRRLIKNDFDRVFKEVDAILTPSSPTPAFKIGEKIKDPLKMYLSDVYTISSNLAGIPAASIPCGFTKDNLPVGMQLMAKDFDEEIIIKIADFFQSHTDFHQKIPQLK